MSDGNHYRRDANHYTNVMSYALYAMVFITRRGCHPVHCVMETRVNTLEFITQRTAFPRCNSVPHRSKVIRLCLLDSVIGFFECCFTRHKHLNVTDLNTAIDILTDPSSVAPDCFEPPWENSTISTYRGTPCHEYWSRRCCHVHTFMR